MKKISFLIAPAFIFLLNFSATCQQAPQWTKNLDTNPDSASLFPVKTLTDANNNILVLSTYMKTLPPSSVHNKIHLYKFDSNGNLLWNLIFDNNGNGEPRGFDMALDNSGNCFIAGGFMSSPNYQPLLLKVSTGGTVQWQSNSTIAFNTGRYDQLILNNNLLYLRTESGIAAFDLNGVEKWSMPVASNRIAVDHSGRMLVAAYLSSMITLLRYDSLGIFDLSLSTILADRIAIDADNNFYLFTQWPAYELVKFDNNGVFQWTINSFPPTPPFGDIGFEMLTDFSNDVIVIGLADSMYKFHPDGNLAWTKSMNGMDSYRIDAKIIYSNILAIAGSTSGIQGNDVMVALFDLNGNRNWYGTYNSNNQQEFSVSMAIDNSGIYVLEDSISNSSLLKFESPNSSMPVDYTLVCVDSVWYEPSNPLLINVHVFNGNIPHLNYPSVQIISPMGDTIGNRINWVNFFAHMGNDYQIYQDTITVAGITDFSNYTFLINENFGDTTGSIGWCSTLGIEGIQNNKSILYPNPANNTLYMSLKQSCKNCQLEIFSLEGKSCRTIVLNEELFYTFDVSEFPDGMYVIRLSNDLMVEYIRFVKQ